MIKFFNYTVKLVIIFLFCFALLIFSAFWYFSSGLPDYKKLSKYQPPVSSRVYAENGALIAEYAIEKRLFIPYNSIPKKVINSFSQPITKIYGYNSASIFTQKKHLFCKSIKSPVPIFVDNDKF